MLSMRKILVATDLSLCSRRALQEAHGIALTFKATIDLLYVWTAPPLVAPEAVITGMGINEQPLHQWLGHGARERLSRFEDEATSAGIALNESFCDVGDPRAAIVLRAAAGGYDLLVLGTHGRSGFAHAMLGSVAEKVIRHAPCPVLTVRSPD